MSLTSYRAAPPRVQRKSLWDLSRLRKARALCGSVPSKLRSNLSRVHEAPNTKGRFDSGPCYRLWAVEFAKRRFVFHELRLADLAATDSPAS